MANGFKFSFERYEKKYFLTEEQYDKIRNMMAPFIQPDEYEKSTIANIYYDTDDWRLIRASIEKPIYKEKLRVRSYGGDGVFIELKKKYKGVVYKRRITSDRYTAEKYLSGEASVDAGQIGREIEWFQHNYRAVPKVYIAYDRLAYVASDDKDLRITFDFNMRWRTDDLDISHSDGCQPITDDGKILMELKIAGAVPLWLTHILSKSGAVPTSFSKYGTCYTRHILNNQYSKEALYSA